MPWARPSISPSPATTLGPASSTKPGCPRTNKPWSSPTRKKRLWGKQTSQSFQMILQLPGVLQPSHRWSPAMTRKERLREWVKHRWAWIPSLLSPPLVLTFGQPRDTLLKISSWSEESNAKWLDERVDGFHLLKFGELKSECLRPVTLQQMVDL